MPIEPEFRFIDTEPCQTWPRWHKIQFTGSVSRTVTDARLEDGVPVGSGGDSEYEETQSVELDRWVSPGPLYFPDPAFPNWGMAYSERPQEGGLMTYRMQTDATEGSIIMGIIMEMTPALTPSDRMRGRPDGRRMLVTGGIIGGSPPVGIPETFSSTVTAGGVTTVRNDVGQSTLEIDLEDITSGAMEFSGSTSFVQTFGPGSGYTGTYTVLTTANLQISLVE